MSCSQGESLILVSLHLFMSVLRRRDDGMAGLLSNLREYKTYDPSNFSFSLHRSTIWESHNSAESFPTFF